MDFDPDGLLERFGIETRLGGAPTVEPPLSSAGGQAQAALLRELASIRAAVEIMESLARNHPTNDAAFDAMDRLLASGMAAACEALKRLRERRECMGAA